MTAWVLPSKRWNCKLKVLVRLYLIWFGDCVGFAFKKVKLQVESLSKALSDQIQTVYEWFDETESERTTLFGYIHLTVSKCSFLMAGFSKCTHQHQWCLNDRDCLLIYIMCDHQEIMPFVIFALFHSEFPNYSNPTQHDAKLRQYDYLHWCKYISVCSLCVCVFTFGELGFHQHVWPDCEFAMWQCKGWLMYDIHHAMSAC